MTRYSLINRILLSLFAKMVIILSLMSTFNLQVANAAGHSASGTITFRGAIVEAPCENHFKNGAMETSCWNHGKTETVRSKPASFKNGSIHLPDYKGKVSFKWIDRKKNLGIYNITYN